MLKKIKSFFVKRHTKKFYITTASQLIVVVQVVATATGHDQVITEALKNQILQGIDALCVILSMFGLVTDQTKKEV